MATAWKKVPFLRWSFWRMAIGIRHLLREWQVGDGREERLARYVAERARRGDAADVLRVIDQYGYEESFLINVGDEKGRIVDDAIVRSQPKRILELGAGTGLPADGGRHPTAGPGRFRDRRPSTFHPRGKSDRIAAPPAAPGDDPAGDAGAVAGVFRPRAGPTDHDRGAGGRADVPVNRPHSRRLRTDGVRRLHAARRAAGRARHARRAPAMRPR